jgi:TRAP transporter TAXI family solute receptor
MRKAKQSLGSFPINPVHPYRRRLFITAVAVTMLIIGALLWWALNRISPLPPTHLVMTTGAEGGSYQELGKEYRDFLAREGITVELRPSQGDVENLARLRDSSSGVDFGLLQGGLTSESESPGISSLGTVSIQPLWFFYRGRGQTPAGMFQDFKGLRLSIGPMLSGSRALATELLLRSGIDTADGNILALEPDSAAAQLIEGRIDAAVMLTGWEAPAVQNLLRAPGISLLPLKRVDAFVALYPFLSKVVLPEGTGDMVTNNPPTDVALLADKSSLVIRDNLHPAIQYLLLYAAEEIHSRPGIFNEAGEFPANESIDLPISRFARQFYKSGRPFLQRYMPFWLAGIVERAAIVLVPLLGIMVPLVRMAPSIYGWRIRRRILGVYTELRSLEHEVDARGTAAVTPELTARLEELEKRAHEVKLPSTYTPMLYTLRDHIVLVRKRLEQG